MAHLPRPLKLLLDLPDERRRLGPFQLVAPLGRGGFAPVWLAREVYGATELRTAAVKLFSLDTPDGSASSRAASLYRARVIDEARALCRVEHPNIVRFYALPTDEGRGVMGLAMEHVAGMPLDRRLAEVGTLSVGETLSVGAAIASALAAVHRAGLVHRDVKPANIVEAGVYKLIDFGIAAADQIEPVMPARSRRLVSFDDLPLEITGAGPSMLDGAEAISAETLSDVSSAGRQGAGTLGYMDPVCVATGAAATPASDLYALGATLFECLSGKLPCAAGRSWGIDAAILEGQKPSPSLLSVVPDAPSSLAHTVDAMLAPDRHDRPRSAEWVAIELDRLRIALSGLDRALPPEDVGPFRGLGRFEEGDRDVYFGRASEIAAALDMLRGLGVVALVGSSGSGKSSLARAGVLPRVVEGALGDWPKRWDSLVVTPGSDARGGIAAALAALCPQVPDAAAMTPEAVFEALTRRPESTDRGLVLLVDQLEELVTNGCGEGGSWVTELLALIGERALPGVRALVTVRRDLLDPLLGMGRFGKALVRGSLLVAPMSDAVWGDVVEQALSTYGYSLEDEELRRALLEELAMTATAMPLVQFALTELWRKRDREARKITRASLSAIGGIAGALERHADATLAGLVQAYPGADRAARDVLLALTTPQGTRAVRASGDLTWVGGPLGREVLATLEGARLVAREAEGVTLAHEALVTQWGRLRAWVAEARADRLLAEEIERDAERWRADETAPLWKKRRLEAAEDVFGREAVSLSEAAAAFVRAGRRAEERSLLLSGGSVVGVVALVVLGVVFYIRDVNAQRVEADRATARAEQNLAEANERKRENEKLVQKLRDAEDANALRKVQEEARQTTHPVPPPPASSGTRSLPTPGKAAPASSPASVSAPPRATAGAPSVTAQPGGGFF